MIRASDLTGCVVRTESGRKIGRVHDLRLQGDGSGTWRLLGIALGRSGLFERLGVRHVRRSARVSGSKLVPWEAIIQLEEGLVTVRDQQRQLS